jgi:hypothetical protein
MIRFKHLVQSEKNYNLLYIFILRDFNASINRELF